MTKIIKLFCIGMLFAVALATGILSRQPWHLVVAIALGFSWFGDAFLANFSPLTRNVRDPFMVGMSFFALAQIAYIIAFWQSLWGMPALHMAVPGMPKGIDLIGGLLPVYVLAGMLYWLLMIARTEHPLVLKIATAVYGCLLMTMAASACAAAFTGSFFAWPLIVGGTLFVISDGIIAAHVFADRFPNQKRYDFVVWATYLPAQIMLYLGSSWLY